MFYAFLLSFCLSLEQAGTRQVFTNPIIEQHLFMEVKTPVIDEVVEVAPVEEKTEETKTEEKADATQSEVTATETEITDVSSNEGEADFTETELLPVSIYPTTTVNVRTLPSTEGEIIRQVTISDELTAIAEVRTYKGQPSFFYKLGDNEYISGDYVSFEKTEPITSKYVPVVKEGIEYYTCGNTVTLPSGGYDVSSINIGLKVIWINKALLGTTTAKYTQDTINAVTTFQTNANLPVTGVVDLATWLALGYSEDEWYNLGTYITPMKVSAGATHEECVNAMIQTAIEYMNAGTDYRIGCSGAPGQYADCSGFIFQCLYSIGVNPTINIVDHALAVKEYTSRDLCADDRLGLPVAISDMQPGDLIFYSSNGYNVTHVGMYAGNNKMYDSNSGGVKLRSIWNTSTFVKVVRVCP